MIMSLKTKRCMTSAMLHPTTPWVVTTPGAVSHKKAKHHQCEHSTLGSQWHWKFIWKYTHIWAISSAVLHYTTLLTVLVVIHSWLLVVRVSVVGAVFPGRHGIIRLCFILSTGLKFPSPSIAWSWVWGGDVVVIISSRRIWGQRVGISWRVFISVVFASFIGIVSVVTRPEGAVWSRGIRATMISLVGTIGSIFWLASLVLATFMSTMMYHRIDDTFVCPYQQTETSGRAIMGLVTQMFVITKEGFVMGVQIGWQHNRYLPAFFCESFQTVLHKVAAHIISTGDIWRRAYTRQGHTDYQLGVRAVTWDDRH